MPEDKDTKLVLKGDLETSLKEMLKEGTEIIRTLEIILPSVSVESIRAPLEKKLSKAKEVVVALQAGYIPITGYFVSVDTKRGGMSVMSRLL